MEHGVRVLVAQRGYALALGYEDLNDHDELRRDSLLALLVGRSDLTGRADGARVRISMRKVWLSFSESYALPDSFARILANLRSRPPWLAAG